MTKRVVLGVDLDQVCLNYVDAFRKQVAKSTGVSLEELPDPTNYSFIKSGWPLSDEKHFALTHGEGVEEGIYTELEAFEHVSDVLKRLSKLGYHIRIITSRFVNHGQHYKVLSQTAESLDNAGIPYHDIAFTAHKHEIYADVYFDDAPSNIASLRENGKHAVVFTASYNHDVTGPRVNDWLEIEDYVLRNFPLGNVM